MEDEGQTFWCFVHLMKKLAPKFKQTNDGKEMQLVALSKLVEERSMALHKHFKNKDCLHYHFCIEWLLTQFKRLFRVETTMRLWEVLWTDYRGENFYLFDYLSILKRHSKAITQHDMSFEAIVSYYKELKGQMDDKLDMLLQDAEGLWSLTE